MNDWDERLAVLLDLRRYADGVTAAREAIARNPDSGSAYTYLARFLVEEGYLQEAREAARIGVPKEPGDSWSHAILALCQLRLGRREEALAETREAIRCDVTFAYAYELAAEILLKLDRNLAAERIASEGLKHVPDDAGLLNMLAWAQFSMNACDKGIATAESALRLYPRSAPLMNTLACALRKRGRPGDVERAAELLLEAIRLDPSRQVYRNNLAKNVTHRTATTNLPQQPDQERGDWLNDPGGPTGR